MSGDIDQVLHASLVVCAHWQGNIGHGLHALNIAMRFQKTTLASVRRHRPKFACIKCGVCATTSDIGHGLETLNVACIIFLAISVVPCVNRQTTTDIVHILHTSEVRIWQTKTSFKGFTHQISCVRINRGTKVVACAYRPMINDIYHCLDVLTQHVCIWKITSANVTQYWPTHTCIKSGVCATAGNISHGLHALDVAYSNHLGDIIPCMCVSTTLTVISHGLLTSEVCIWLTTSTNIKQHLPRHADIKHGVCAQLKRYQSWTARNGLLQKTSVMACTHQA